MKRLPARQGQGVSGGGCRGRGRRSAALAAIPFGAWRAGAGALLGLLVAACNGPKTGPGLEPPLIPGGNGTVGEPTGGARSANDDGSFGNGPGAGGAGAGVPGPQASTGTGGAAMAPGSDAGSMASSGSGGAPAGAGDSASGAAGSGTSNGGTTSLPSSSCEVARFDATLGVHLVVDESLGTVVPVDLWTPLGQALDAWSGSDAASSTQLALELFAGSCDAGAYADASLPLAPAAEQQSKVQSIMDGSAHGLGAATALALDGAIAQARQWAQNGGGNPAIVLISASDPNACALDAPGAATMSAAAGLSSEPAVPTYVLALSQHASLNAIAAAGGTSAARSIESATSSDALIAAMDAIASDARCRIALPAGSAQYVPDRVSVEVERGATKMQVPRVSDASACGSEAGWYFDDAAMPRFVIACPDTCAQAAGGGLQIVLGCPTPTR